MKSNIRSGVGVSDQLAGVIDDLRGVFDRVKEPCGDGPTPELVEQIRQLQSIVAVAQAAQVVQTARFAAHSERQDEHGHWVDAELSIGQVDEYAADLLAPVLQVSPGSAQYRISTAAKVAAELPETLNALATGQLDLPRVRVIVEELMLADACTCSRVEALVYPRIHGASARQVRHQVRRALAQVDADALARRVRVARTDRFVKVGPAGEPGVSEWWAHLPAEASATCWAAVDELAHQRKNADPEVLMDQARADALVDLILGSATVTARVAVAIPVVPVSDGTSGDRGIRDAGEVTSAGSGGGPRDTSLGVEIPGVGVIPARYIDTLTRTFGTTITRMLIDARTGTVMETGCESYRPASAIARQVKIRDGTCRFPNCAVRAERCDLDHVVPWPLGPTAPANLISLCRHHHRLKTFTRWSPELTGKGSLAGTVTWTDPYGERWVTTPVDHTELTAA